MIACSGAVFIVLLPHTSGTNEALLRRLPLSPSVRETLRRVAEQILLGVRAFHNRRRLAEFILLTMVIWSCDAICIMIGARSLGLTISLAILLLTALGIRSALPATPGNIGIYQFVAVTVLTPFGIGRDKALAYSLISQVLGLVVILRLSVPGLYWPKKDTTAR